MISLLSCGERERERERDRGIERETDTERRDSLDATLVTSSLPSQG